MDNPRMGWTLACWLCLLAIFFIVGVDAKQVWLSLFLILGVFGSGLAATLSGERPRYMAVVPMTIMVAVVLWLIFWRF